MEDGLPMELSSTHSILLQLPIPPNGPMHPLSTSLENLSYEDYVKMPHYEHSKIKWSRIVKYFETKITDVDALKETISSYNELPITMKSLSTYLDKCLSIDEKAAFFQVLLPDIIELALSLPTLIAAPIPLLQKHSTASITLSQKQIACLLANAFLCTFPDKRPAGEKCGIGSYPDINFSRLFGRSEPNAVEKWKCLFNYFKRVTSTEPDGVVSFTRQVIKEEHQPDFHSSNLPLPPLEVYARGSMMEVKQHLIVDFADKYIGGMVFVKGCVQEEILFLFYPELIVTRLFTEKLEEGEAIIATGVERFNSGEGYSRSFKWTGSFDDTTEKDAYRRRTSGIIAIDAASYFRRGKQQYDSAKMHRDVLKAYAGFKPISQTTRDLLPIATGNWGCGIFAGNPRLKSLLQLIAAGFAQRKVTYFAYGNLKLTSDLKDIYQHLQFKDIKIGHLMKILCLYAEKRNPALNAEDLYPFIKKHTI